VIDADLAARDKYKREVDELLENDSVLLLPVVPERGPLKAWADDELLAYRVACFRLTAPSSLAGAPQVVLPTSAEAGYVPLGLLAQAGSDRLLLNLVDNLAKGDPSVAL
jgi:amidase